MREERPHPQIWRSSGAAIRSGTLMGALINFLVLLSCYCRLGQTHLAAANVASPSRFAGVIAFALRDVRYRRRQVARYRRRWRTLSASPAVPEPDGLGSTW